jgi:hypothetical protein
VLRIVHTSLALGNILVAGSLGRVTGLPLRPVLQYPWRRLVALGTFVASLKTAVRSRCYDDSRVRTCGSMYRLDSTSTDASSPESDDVVGN